MTIDRYSSEGQRNPVYTFLGGGVIGAPGGLIGLGGAEFRLPLLIGIFRFAALEAVILNKAMSLVVVCVALPFRLTAVPLESLVDHWDAIANLLCGSLIGAWIGAGWATKLKSASLYKIIASLLVLIAAALVFGHGQGGTHHPLLSGWAQIAAGAMAGFCIGIVASLLGVAGGELLIPTFVLLFDLDVKLAGSLSLAVSLPTMIVGFTRYSQDKSFAVLGRNRMFLLIMAAGSICGTFIGALLLKVAPSSAILPLLAVILLISAFKIWRHT